MTTVKVKFRPSTVTEREGTIYYQITHERKVRQLLSDYKVFPHEWDDKRSTVATNHYSDRRPFIMSICERIRWDVERLMKVIRSLDSGVMSYTVDDVIEGFNRYASECSLSNCMESAIVRLRQNGRIRTAETYKSTLNNFSKFLFDTEQSESFNMHGDIMLDCLTSEIIEAYEAWQRRRGVALNTVSFYTRILRAVYNRAVEQGIIENRNPFKRVYTGIDKTVKRAIPLSAIREIKHLDLSLTPALSFARDMFMMSFCLRGMSFIDMAFLKKTDLKNGYITYRRRKTGQSLIIEWTPEMQMILDRYPENRSDYLLPIIRNTGTNERCTYRNVGYNINRNLKKVAEMVGIRIPLTLYVARHSWASVARAKGIPVSVISEGMGHDSEATTRIYLACLDTSVVDRANSLILKSLK